VGRAEEPHRLDKTSPGQGSFYRSQHELIFAWKVGEAPHLNAFGLGAPLSFPLT